MPDNKVNLPNTSFPMRGNLPQREPELINFWSDIKLYNKIRSKRKGGISLFSTMAHLTQMEIFTLELH